MRPPANAMFRQLRDSAQLCRPFCITVVIKCDVSSPIYPVIVTRVSSLSSDVVLVASRGTRRLRDLFQGQVEPESTRTSKHAFPSRRICFSETPLHCLAGSV